jgi:lipoyl synthase
MAQMEKKRGGAKTARSCMDADQVLAKPSWIKAKAPVAAEVRELTGILRNHSLHTVCEEANCPNLGECFQRGTATFMIMGDICTRRCPFCDVAHGRPAALDEQEPEHLAAAIQAMGLRYVVITSVNRDDLADGGAGHFGRCIGAIRATGSGVQIEILVPDFRGHVEAAFEGLAGNLPDVFNHNLETVPRLYREARPGARYSESLQLLQRFKARFTGIPTKSGLMVGLGETDEEILTVMRDLRAHGCDMLTVGQYLRPSRHHLPVQRYVTPEQFDEYREEGLAMGFAQVASGPLVRSSYHADLQAREVLQ